MGNNTTENKAVKKQPAKTAEKPAAKKSNSAKTTTKANTTAKTATAKSTTTKKAAVKTPDQPKASTTSVSKSEPTPVASAGKKMLNVKALTAIVIAAVLAVVAVVAVIAIVANKRHSVYVHHKQTTLEYVVKDGEVFNKPTDLQLDSGESIIGFYTDEQLTQEYDFSQKVTDDIHLYTKTKVVYQQTIHFNVNGATGSVDTTTKNSDVELTLPDVSTMSRLGYTFLGWATSSTATADDVLDTPEELLLDGTTETTLYAVWELTQYQILFRSYTTIGDNITQKNYTMFYTMFDDITLPTATKSNADVSGWKVTSFLDDGETSWTLADTYAMDNLALGSGHYGNIAVTLQYTTHDYRLIFDAEGKENLLTELAWLFSDEEEDYIYCNVSKGFKEAYKMDGDTKVYVFDSTENKTDSTITYAAPLTTGITGWQALNSNGVSWTTIKASGTTQISALKLDKENKTVTFFPKWGVAKFTLHCTNPETNALDNNFSKYGLSSMSHSIEYGDTEILPTPYCDGYEFLGWYTALEDGERFANNDEVTATWVSSSNTKVYARWKLVSVTVNYNANCDISELTGSETTNIAATPVDPNTDTTIINNPFVRNGYTFVGWSTAADGSGTTYQPNATLNVGATTSKIELYAIWTPSN